MGKGSASVLLTGDNKRKRSHECGKGFFVVEHHHQQWLELDEHLLRHVSQRTHKLYLVNSE